jgi:hypothetical protein
MTIPAESLLKLLRSIFTETSNMEIDYKYSSNGEKMSKILSDTSDELG